MAELGHGTGQDMTRRPPGGSNITPSDVGPVKHTWVLQPDGTRLPGLLWQWRQTEGGSWEGYVVCPDPARPGGTAIMQGWLPAERLARVV